MKLFTIGFTKTSAQHFFERIKISGAKKIIDVRLSNVSQLAGFAKRDDLEYFSNQICHVAYQHMPELAPTRDMLDAFKKEKGSWSDYADQFLMLMAKRKIENIDRREIDGGCLLCSEDRPHNCHRRLVAEYLSNKWGDMEIEHL